MDMVRVDPKLFITCRLCLVETGTYQVTPTVAEEIEYCFSITVDQYDGLPQLICEKCQKILNEYTTLKKTFVGRQNALKTHLQIRKEVQETLAHPPPQQEAVSSSQQAEDDEDNDFVVHNHLKAKRRKSRFISASSSASSDRQTSRSSSLLTDKSRPQKRKATSREPWEEFFNKRLACKICNRNVKFTSNLTNHLKVHAGIISEHKHILDRPCEVRLIKLDTQPNLTGNSETVVLRNDKIIGKQKVNGFIIYTPKGNTQNIIARYNKEHQKTQGEEKAEAEKVPQSGDDSDFEIKSTNHKRPRLLSTDTVVLNDDDKSSVTPESNKKIIQNDAEIECIDLDDSSNSSTQTNDERTKDSISLVQPKDIEAIKNIIKVCHSKYIDRKNKMSEWNNQPNTSKNKDPHLKAKLLSMGRKIIKNEGLSCTGLLRFMEHKNLAVKWIPNVGRKASKEGNYVRIMPRLKGRHELIADNTGWKNRILQKKSPSAPPEPSENHEGDEAFPENIENSSQCVTDSVSTNDLSDVAVTSVSNADIQMTSPTFIGAVERLSLPMILIPDLIVKPEDNKILLNANPVANPKQLPKKSVIPESKVYIQAALSSIASQNATNNNENNQENICVDLVETAEETAEMCMPIITSTTSLSTTATPANDDKVKDVDMNAVTSIEQSADKPAPFRLKVKHVSEINSAINCKAVLSEKNNRIGPSENVWTFKPDQIHMNLTAPTTTAEPRPAVTAVPTQAIMEIPDEDSEDSYGSQRSNHTSVIMDTAELPNTKTNSPFRYVRDLLKIHNIVVMEPTDFITGEFTCLIKFKLQIQRNVNQSPLTLCLSVHCKDNKFYLGVKDPNSATNLDLNKLPANWQWEILKIYKTREDVKVKMTQNAQKHGQTMYSYTQTFLCVLKSITFKSIANDT